jgi:hypothetical protein
VDVAGRARGLGLRIRGWWRLRPLHRHDEITARPLLILIGILVIAIGVLWIVGRWETLRRSAEAPIAIRSTLFQPGGGFEQVRQGTWIDYTYVVDGVTFAARDFRQWIVVPDHRPKVCYAPSDPADHLLVNGRIVCGRDAGP